MILSNFGSFKYLIIGRLGRTLQSNVDRVLSISNHSHPKVRDETLYCESKARGLDDLLVSFSLLLILSQDRFSFSFGPELRNCLFLQTIPSIREFSHPESIFFVLFSMIQGYYHRCINTYCWESLHLILLCLLWFPPEFLLLVFLFPPLSVA